MTNNMPFTAAGISFQNLSVVRNNNVILNDINATAPPCGATVIIGPNGAGKTTLLRCLLNEISYTGRISFFNNDHKHVFAPVIGFVPQILQADSGLPLRVYEFMALAFEKKPLWLGCSKNIREKNRYWLELTGAEHLENRKLSDLSGGEMRRVLLAAALSRKPGLLLLDEAEAGVDYKGERLFWELLDKSRKEFGFTLLMVSHNLPLAAHYATHVICIKQKLLAEGTPQETLTSSLLQHLFGAPIHLYPDQCLELNQTCPDCGALGNLPHIEKTIQKH